VGISLIHNVFIILDRFTLANRNRTQREDAPAGALARGLNRRQTGRRAKEEISGQRSGEFTRPQS